MKNQPKASLDCKSLPQGLRFEDTLTLAAPHRYGAAFKRAQRSLLLHDVALNIYKSVMPEVPERALQDFLHGRQ